MSLCQLQNLPYGYFLLLGLLILTPSPLRTRLLRNWLNATFISTRNAQAPETSIFRDTSTCTRNNLRQARNLAECSTHLDSTESRVNQPATQGN
ncbi:MAG: hypothetical protein [Cressdnaviricota sp.]|nr:MAG: hypothetical protein [Cressdnaviricota sp.]